MNKKEFEQYMNETYTDDFNFSVNDAKEFLAHLGDEETIEEYYNNHTLGSLTRKENKELFNQLYDENK